MPKKLNRKERGLGKYDAPLRVQFQMGYSAFKSGHKLSSPFSIHTMQHREWERGFNKAYYENLDRGIHEVRKRSKGFHGQKKQRSENTVRNSHRNDLQAKRV